ncbi:hypothetical protein JB92DRAFT_3006368, partial [Gautieria morchelliformis]
LWLLSILTFVLILEGAPRSTLLSTLSSCVLVALRLASLLWLACLERFLPCYYYICQSCTLVILRNAYESCDLAVLV